jgi:hypothetical protein
MLGAAGGPMHNCAQNAARSNVVRAVSCGTAHANSGYFSLGNSAPAVLVSVRFRSCQVGASTTVLLAANRQAGKCAPQTPGTNQRGTHTVPFASCCLLVGVDLAFSGTWGDGIIYLFEKALPARLQCRYIVYPSHS